MYFNILICLLLFVSCAFSYPSGAPDDACSSLSPERGHGAPSQPVAQAPFYVVAHGKKFNPGDKIGGKSISANFSRNSQLFGLHPHAS